VVRLWLTHPLLLCIQVWALLDTDDSGLPIWRQARVLCAVPPNRPSGGEWQFVLYTKHDDYRYILRAKPTEISPVKGMKFDCIHYDESIDIADHDFGKKVDVDLYDGNRASTHPFVAEELQALRTQLATASQKNDDMRMELEERRTSEARLRKELQDAKNQVQFLDQQLAISEAKNAPEVPRVTAAERQKYDSTIRALMDRTEQLSMENERNKNEAAELRARLANNPVREADYAQGYRARAEAAEAENAAMRRAMNDLQGMLNEADHNRGAGAAMRAKDDEIAQLRYALSAAQRNNTTSNTNDSLLQAKDEEIARLKRSLHDQLARPAAADATTVKARDDEIARLRASINELQVRLVLVHHYYTPT
jgi:chromosome segregation ATPase